MPGAGTLGARRITTRARAQQPLRAKAATSGATLQRSTPTSRLTLAPASKDPPPGPTTTSSGGGSRTATTSGGSRTTTAAPAGGGGGTSSSDAAARRARELQNLRAAIGALPLDPSLIAQFAERQRAVQSALQAAQLMREQQGAQADLDFEQFSRQLDQRTGQAIGDLRGEAAARNLAFQPAFVGTGLRDIRDEAGQARTQAEQQRAQFMAGLERMVQQAQQQSAAEMAAIARERARAQADHRGFINQQLGALNF